MTSDETDNHAGGSGDAPSTPGGEPPRPVEDRINVSTVSPDDYPDARKGDSGVSGGKPPPA